MKLLVNSVEQTFDIGKQIGEKVSPGDIICLEGDLGTGKTHLTKGIASGLSIDEHITSPTFNIVNEYTEGRLKLYHFDVYRVYDPDEIAAIGFDEYIFSNGVSVIEWANYIDELIPPSALYIKISKDLTQGENFREIQFQYSDTRYDYIKEITL